MSAATDLEVDVLNIQCYHPSFSLDISSPRNFAIDNIKSQVIHDKEAEDVARIEASYDQGIELVHMVYTFRSLSRAIPDIVSYLNHDSCLAYGTIFLTRSLSQKSTHFFRHMLHPMTVYRVWLHLMAQCSQILMLLQELKKSILQ